MTDLTMTPRIVNTFLIMLVLVDVLTGQWSIFTSLAAFLLVGWNTLLFYLTHQPQKPPLTKAETVTKYPDLWGWYFKDNWVDFWEMNDKEVEK